MTRRTPAAKGFSLVEVMIVAALLGVVMIIVSSLAATGADAQDYARRLNRVTEVNQDLVDGIRMDLVGSVTLFGRDTLSQAHLDAVDLGAWPAPLATALPPRVAPTEEPQSDAHDPLHPKTGNMLFFARKAWVDTYRVPSSGRTFMTDVYQWVLYYPTRDGDGPRAGSAIGLNLVRWLSEPLADATRILALTDATDRRELCEHLYRGTEDLNGETRPALQLLWSRGSNPAVAGCFQQIDPDSDFDLSAVPLLPRTSPFRVHALETLEPKGMLAYRHHSVCSVHAPSTQRANLYGIPNLTGDGFPHGFEVQIVGPSAARQVVVRSVLVSTSNRGLLANSVLQTVVDCRDI